MDTSERYDLDDKCKIEKKSQSLTLPILNQTSSLLPDSEDSSPLSASPNLTISTQQFSLNHLMNKPPPQNLNETAKTPNLNDLPQIEDDFSFKFNSDDDDDNYNFFDQDIGIDDNFLF